MLGATGVPDSVTDVLLSAGLACYCRVWGRLYCFLPVLPAYQGVINDHDFCRLAELR